MSRRRKVASSVETARAVTAALKLAEAGKCRCECRCDHADDQRALSEPSWWFVSVRWPGLGRRRSWGPRFRVLARSAEEARVRVWPRLGALDTKRVLAWRFELSIHAAYGDYNDCEDVR